MKAGVVRLGARPLRVDPVGVYGGFLAQRGEEDSNLRLHSQAPDRLLGFRYRPSDQPVRNSAKDCNACQEWFKPLTHPLPLENEQPQR